MNRRARTFLGLAAAAGLAVPLTLVLRPEPRARPPAGAVIGAAAEDAERPLVRRWQAGTAATYDLELTSAVLLRPAALSQAVGGQKGGAPGAKAGELRIAGALEEVVLAADAGGARTWLHMEAPRVDGEGASADAAAEVAAALRAGVVVRWDARGRAAEIEVPTASPVAGRAMVTHLVASLQVALPDDPGAGAWTIDEASASGPIAAHYVVDGAEGARRRLAKRLERTQAEAGFVEKIDGELRVAFDAEAGRVAALTGTIRQDVVSARGGELLSRGEARIALGLRGVAPARALPALELGAARALDDVDRAAEERARLEALVGGIGFAELEQRLAGVADLDDAAREELERLLAAYLRLHPAAAAGLGARAAALPRGDAQRTSLLRALMRSGDDAAQLELAAAVDVWRAQDDEVSAAGGIAGLAMLPSPSAATIDYLSALAESPSALAPAAELALGNVARRLADGDAPAAADLMAPFLAELAAGAEPDRAEVLLRVLGNSGTAKLVEVVGPYLVHGHAPLRAAAASSLRFVVDARADQLLGGRITAEADHRVLMQVLLAISLRPLAAEVRAALAERAAEELPPELRAVIAEQLARS